MAGIDIYLRSGQLDQNPNDVRLYESIVDLDGLIEASADQTIAAVTQTVAANVLIQAAATQTISAITQICVAQVIVQATASQTIGVFTQTTTSAVLIQSSSFQTISAITQAATGQVLIQGTASQLIDAITQTATDQIVVNAIALQTTGDFTQDATATISQPVTATVTSVGSYNMYRAPDLGDKEPKPKEAKYIGPAEEWLTFRAKGTDKQARTTNRTPSVLTKIENDRIQTRRISGAKLRQQIIADDEWLMMN